MLGRHLFLLSFLSSQLVVPIVLRQGTENRRPVPSEWLRGDTLWVPKHNFSIRGPTNWHWTQQTLGIRGALAEAFVATAPSEDSALVVASFDVPVWPVDASSFNEGFVRGMLNKLPEGWTVADFSVISKPIPAAPSTSMYRARLAGPNDAVIYQIGYLVRGKPGYLIMMASPDAAEPLPLRQGVETFRVLDQHRAALRLPAALAIGRPRTLFVGLLIGFLIIELFLRARARRSPLPPQQSLTFLSRLLLLLGVAFALVFTQVEIPLSDPSDPSAEALGAIIGVLLISSGIAYVAYGRKAKRNPNKFARLFCALCFLVPACSAAGQMAR